MINFVLPSTLLVLMKRNKAEMEAGPKTIDPRTQVGESAIVDSPQAGPTRRAGYFLVDESLLRKAAASKGVKA